MTKAVSQRATGSVQLRLLGLPLLTSAKGDPHALARKDAALLARLAAEGPCARSALAAWLWPSAYPQQARSHLRQRLSRLSRLAGAPLFTGPDPLNLADQVRHDLAPVSGLPQTGTVTPAPMARLLAALDFSDLPELDDWVRTTAAELAAVSTPSKRPEPAAPPTPQTLDSALSVSLLRPPHLVGRDKLWSTLVSSSAAGKVVVLQGEPGAGKSRLLSDFAWSQTASVRVKCRPGDEQQPYALLSRLLRAALPSPCPVAPLELQVNLSHLLRQTAEAPTQELQAQRLPALLHWALGQGAPATGRTVAVDDLQHCDTASLEALLPMLQMSLAELAPVAPLRPVTPIEPVRPVGPVESTQPSPSATALPPSAAASPPRWIFAVRSAEVPSALQTWLDGAEGQAAVTLPVAPLDASAVRALLSSLQLPQLDLPWWASTLHRHTGGNPLYLLQTLSDLLLSRSDPQADLANAAYQAWALPTPQGALQLLQRRIHQLSASARVLLQVAALAGQDFDVALAAAVLHQHPLDLADGWLQLEQAHLMQGREIAHDLVAEAARLTVSADDAPLWHARLATHLAQRSGHDAAFARTAMHWRSAGHWPEAGLAFRQAASAIEKQLRKTEEAALLLQAADCYAKAQDVDAEAETLFLMFKAHWTRKNMPDIRAAMTRLQGLPATPRAQLWAQITRAVVDFDHQPDDDSLQRMVSAQAGALALGDRALALWMVGWEVGSLAKLNRHEQALQAVPRALALINSLPVDAQSCSALSQCGITLEFCCRPAPALVLLKQAVALYRSRGEEALAAEIECHQSLCHYHLGQIDQASQHLEAGRLVMAQINDGEAPPYMSDYYQARFWREQGRLGPALELMLHVLARLATNGDTTLRAICGIEAGLAYVRLGQAHRAKPYLEAPRTLAAMQGRVDGLLLEADVARAAGQATTALLLQALNWVPQCTRSERWRWRVQLELSREMAPAAAIQLMQTNIKEAAAHQVNSLLLPSRLMLLLAQTRANDVAGAHQQALALETALNHSAAMVVYAGEYYLHMTHALEAAADDIAARRVLRRGLAWLDAVRRDHVPVAFQASFLERNSVNRQLLALAQRLVT